MEIPLYLRKQKIVMKKLFTLLLLGCFACTARAVTEQLDTLSYALGYQVTHSFIDDDNNKHILDSIGWDRENLAQGVEHTLLMFDSIDSVSRMSMTVGMMQGVFFSDGYYGREENRIPLEWIMQGVEKVARGRLSLPADTVGIMARMTQMTSDTMPSDLSEDEQREFYTFYGILKGYPKGIKEYITELTGRKDVEVNNQTYAAGFYLVLDWMRQGDESLDKNLSIATGKELAQSILMLDTPFTLITKDCLAGCRAALALDQPRVSTEKIEQIIEPIIPTNMVVTSCHN